MICLVENCENMGTVEIADIAPVIGKIMICGTCADNPDINSLVIDLKKHPDFEKFKNIEVKTI